MLQIGMPSTPLLELLLLAIVIPPKGFEQNGGVIASIHCRLENGVLGHRRGIAPHHQIDLALLRGRSRYQQES